MILPYIPSKFKEAMCCVCEVNSIFYFSGVVVVSNRYNDDCIVK